MLIILEVHLINLIRQGEQPDLETREEIKADGRNKPEEAQAAAVLVVLELTKLLLTKGLMAE